MNSLVVIAQAQLLLVAAQHEAAWLGEGRVVNRDAGGRFAPTATGRRVSQKASALDFDDATQKEMAARLESAESRERQKDLGNRVARLGDKELFEEVSDRLIRALKIGNIRPELQAVLEKYPGGIEAFAAIAFTLGDEGLIEVMTEALLRQEEKALIRSIEKAPAGS